jgi:5-methylcytosine-specific restriction endonuclease McrA
MLARKALRKGRRGRNLRYRAARFDNRRMAKGHLPPSLENRIGPITTWARRLAGCYPVSGIDVETVRFDLRALENPEIAGREYQQGTLLGYEVREWVLEARGRRCFYCGAEGVPLQMDHVRCRAHGGTSRPTDLVPCCGKCNQEKGARPVEEFLRDKPDLLAKVLAALKKPLRDAAAVNTTRLAVLERLELLGLPVRAWSGGRTKWNRSRFGVPKSHALDAACTGDVRALCDWQDRAVLLIRSTGRGARQRARVDAHGFPRGHCSRTKRHFGFATGDLVRAVVTRGKKRGTYTGRVAVRATGRFNIQRPGQPTVQGISHRDCRLLMRGDGYGYGWGPPTPVVPMAAPPRPSLPLSAGVSAALQQKRSRG